MKTFETTMRTRRTRHALYGLMAGCMLLTTGCFSTGSDDKDEGAAIAGVVQGDESAAAGKSSAEVEGAVVTVHEVGLDGALGPVVAQGETDAQGAFNVKTDLRGARTLIVRAAHEGKVWKARLKDELREGASHWSRPLNLESTIEADVWLELQKTAPGRSVYSHEVAAAVDADVAASLRADYREADSAARARVAARVAHVARAASQARAGAMAAVAEHVEEAVRKGQEAEAELRVRLHEAKRDTAKIREAREAFLRTVAEAHLEAEVKAAMYARASEAAYHAAVRAADTLSDSARTAFARNSARVLAIASDIALQAHFRAAQASEAQVNNLAEAGARFRAEVEAAASREACDSAFAEYRTEARESFDDAFAALATTLESVSAALDSLSGVLGVQVGASTGDREMGEAYIAIHLQAHSAVLAVLMAMDDEAEAEAVADAVAYLSVRPVHSDD